ncbi:hypothetical protein [Wolbachia endosymbiont of Pentidionis agamae]|uniref:hypothetical protein n=1 Tax=Wolbachia endosymbiont of Pentidionis agamae TaxID=3110435 RepID=UPI002FD5BA65
MHSNIYLILKNNIYKKILSYFAILSNFRWKNDTALSLHDAVQCNNIDLVCQLLNEETAYEKDKDGMYEYEYAIDDLNLDMLLKFYYFYNIQVQVKLKLEHKKLNSKLTFQNNMYGIGTVLATIVSIASVLYGTVINFTAQSQENLTTDFVISQVVPAIAQLWQYMAESKYNLTEIITEFANATVGRNEYIEDNSLRNIIVKLKSMVYKSIMENKEVKNELKNYKYKNVNISAFHFLEEKIKSFNNVYGQILMFSSLAIGIMAFFSLIPCFIGFRHSRQLTLQEKLFDKSEDIIEHIKHILSNNIDNIKDELLDFNLTPRHRLLLPLITQERPPSESINQANHRSLPEVMNVSHKNKSNQLSVNHLPGAVPDYELTSILSVDEPSTSFQRH